MRIINFSADGIIQAADNGFYEWLAGQDADLVCLQDLRTQEFDLASDKYFPQGYFHYFHDNPNNTNGVAIYTRKLPKAIMTGLGFNEFDAEARYIQADFEELSVGSIQVPLATLDDSLAMERKAQFLDLLFEHLEKITHKRREFIFAGSWYIAHTSQDTQLDIDEELPGFLSTERRWLDNVCHQLGYVDAFRECNQDNDEFTWWPEGGQHNGQRIDFQLVSPGLLDLIEYGTIYKNQRFSSHAPVIMDYDLELGEDEF